MAPKSAHLLFAVLSLMAVTVFAAARVGSWKPISNLRDPKVTAAANFAVAQYNKQKSASLVFVRVVKGETQVVAGTNYRLVISVKDAAKLKSYTAVVFAPPRNGPLKLISFAKRWFGLRF